ncbi:MAG: efflux RND transporter periplasmic adaptor subunit [Ignavibacteriaceae bacterium]|nr:efflux RND transporter periplasmic adaptor subunit [Ignavibacteriaceae bacterium]
MANGTKKKSRKKWFIFGGIGLLVIVLIIVALLSGGKDEIISVQTEKVEERNITQTVSATGTINPEFKVVITPEVTGEVISIPVKEGDLVRKGQLLVKIKPDIYVAQKEKLEANLQSAKANLNIRKAELDRVTSEYNRTKELHSKGLASDAELENSKGLYLTTKGQYDVAEANVIQSEASLKEIMENLYKTTIYSPMDGTVTQLNVEVGERVLGSGFTQGTNIMTVADLNNIEASVDVDENDVVLVSIGDTARVKVDAFGDKVFKGVVSEIGNSAQTSGLGTQEQVVNFSVKIKLIDLDPGLRPGMSCNSEIETETKAKVIAVPIQSVTARTEFKSESGPEENEDEANVEVKKKEETSKPKEIVFLVNNNKVKTVEVETGISDDNYIEILKGLKVGDVVVTGSYRAISRELKDGATVRIEDKRKTQKEEK